MKVLFAGSPAIAVPLLRALAASRHELVGVLTNPPSAKGRSGTPEPTAVGALAAEILPGVPVLTPDRLGSGSRALVAPLGAEILVAFAYGRIFGPKFLSLFPAGGLNVHPSLLPRWRGATPIPAAILARDAETGVSVQRIAAELDSGDIVARESIALDGTETTASLSDRCAELGAGLLVRALDALEDGSAVPEPQDASKATYCRELGKDDGLVDWKLDALAIDARVRAFQPWPGAFTFLRGERLALLESRPYPDEDSGLEPGSVFALDSGRGLMVQTGRGLLSLRRLQLRARKALPFREFANGVRDLIGSRLGA
ncbi:MAG: methionyl-tRNA formyltransferase [Spirochaetales bacterium]|nr:methionyl-tRNA formyltransferase [Spirochaetales bacterium]